MMGEQIIERIGHCYRHRSVETGLRCKHEHCGRFICIKCARKTAVGYECPDCARVLEARFYNGRFADYLIATLVTVPLAFIVGLVFVLFSGIGFMIIIAFFAMPLVGKGIARTVRRCVSYRRSRYLARVTIGTFGLMILPFILLSLAVGGWYSAIAMLLVLVIGAGSLKNQFA